MPQLSPSFVESFNAAKRFSFLAVYHEGERAQTFSRTRLIFYVLHNCNVKGVVSPVTSDKVLKGFSFESCVVEAARCYDVPFSRTQKIQTHRQTD